MQISPIWRSIITGHLRNKTNDDHVIHQPFPQGILLGFWTFCHIGVAKAHDGPQVFSVPISLRSWNLSMLVLSSCIPKLDVSSAVIPDMRARLSLASPKKILTCISASLLHLICHLQSKNGTQKLARIHCNSGWGGVGWDLNVPWHLQKKNGTQTLARTYLRAGGVQWGGVEWDVFTKHVLHMASAVGHCQETPDVNSMADSAGKQAIRTIRHIHAFLFPFLSCRPRHWSASQEPSFGPNLQTFPSRI